MGMIGADPAELRALGGAFDADAGTVDTGRSTCGGAVAGVAWHGADASAFKADWFDLVEPVIAGLVERLHAEAEALRRQADEQDEASTAHGGREARTAGDGTGFSIADHGDDTAAILDDLEETDPDEVAQAWSELSDSQRDALRDEYPSSIGNTPAGTDCASSRSVSSRAGSPSAGSL